MEGGATSTHELVAPWSVAPDQRSVGIEPALYQTLELELELTDSELTNAESAHVTSSFGVKVIEALTTLDESIRR